MSGKPKTGDAGHAAAPWRLVSRSGVREGELVTRERDLVHEGREGHREDQGHHEERPAVSEERYEDDDEEREQRKCDSDGDALMEQADERQVAHRRNACDDTEPRQPVGRDEGSCVGKGHLRNRHGTAASVSTRPTLESPPLPFRSTPPGLAYRNGREWLCSTSRLGSWTGRAPETTSRPQI
jgi:hypothetical protein